MPLDTFSCFKCQVCAQVYQRPIKLPCNKTICYSHLCDLNGNIKTSFYCVFCEITHEIHPNRVYPNFYIQHQINKLEKKLVKFNEETSNEIAVVTVESLGGLEVSQFANELGRKWNIGKEIFQLVIFLFCQILKYR